MTGEPAEAGAIRAGPGAGGRGDPTSDPLVGRVYEQLRAIAQLEMNQERPGHTLQATALVHEAYLRLAGASVQWSGPGAFYHAAAEAMRRILIEHARAKGRVKRGGGVARVPLAVDDLAAREDAAEIEAVDRAFRRLEERDSDAAAVVRLRFYAGLSVEQTAAALGLSVRTVAREWTYARAILQTELEALAAEEDVP